MKNVNSPQNDNLCKASERKTNRVHVGCIVRHPQTHSLSNHRKNSRPNFNIHDCGPRKYKMHHKGKETEMLNTNMFAFNHTRLHYT